MRGKEPHLENCHFCPCNGMNTEILQCAAKTSTNHELRIRLYTLTNRNKETRKT